MVCIAYQVLKKPKRGCCATRSTGGAIRFLAILRLRCGFGSSFFGSAGLSSAKACSARALAETSSTSGGDGALATVVAAGAGTMVGRLVSNTMRSGHFRSDWYPDHRPVDPVDAGLGGADHRQLRRVGVRKEQQREQNSANKQKITRHGHFSIAPSARARGSDI